MFINFKLFKVIIIYSTNSTAIINERKKKGKKINSFKAVHFMKSRGNYPLIDKNSFSFTTTHTHTHTTCLKIFMHAIKRKNSLTHYLFYGTSIDNFQSYSNELTKSYCEAKNILFFFVLCCRHAPKQNNLTMNWL